MNRTIVAVWPVVKGLTGINYQTNKPVKLQPFCKGYMFEESATKAAADGNVQLMVGLRPEDLKQEADMPVEPVVVEDPPPAPQKKKSKPKTQKVTDNMLD